MDDRVPVIEVNGAPATADDLRHLVQTNYGHFSAMRVEDGGVRGLDLHLARIGAATRELFGVPIDPERVRACLRHAIAGRAGTRSLRVNIFSRALNRDRLAAVSVPDVLVTVAPTTPVSSTPALRVQSFRYTRTLPHVKHVGTFPLFHYRRLAQQAGFDDAVFVDESGNIEEGSIWNIGFHDGERIVWPDAPRLTGVSMQLLQAGLARNGVETTTQNVSLSQIGQFRSAFFTNSSVAVRMISCIDTTVFTPDPTLVAMLAQCHESNPTQPV